MNESNGDYLLSRVALGSWSDGANRPIQSRKYNGTTGKEVSEFVLASRNLLVERYKKAYEQEGIGRHNLFPVALPAMAQFRTTTRIVGYWTMSDGQHERDVPDSIGLIGGWRKGGHVWEIPYGALVPRGVKGLLAAGRCISSEGDAWEVTQVIPAAALTGQVAGLAATLAVTSDTLPDALPVSDIQEQLENRGIPYRKRQAR